MVKEEDRIDWDRRLSNLRKVMLARGMKPARVALESGLGINTVQNLLKGGGSPKVDTLDAICRTLGIHNVAVLDADDPMSEVRNELFRLAADLTEEQALALLAEAQRISEETDE